MWLAAILFPKEKIVFDAFLSLYDSNVFDRKLYGPKSLRAFKDYLFDWYSLRLASIVLVDTLQHALYFSSAFGIPSGVMRVVPISADDMIFFPRESLKKEDSPFIVHFHGTFIPLQGVSYILDAARALEKEPILFRFAGEGQLFKEVAERVFREGMKNVTLLGRMPLEKIPDSIASSDVCLGIFGDTDKTRRVIPNKVYECIAMNKPVITARTPAILELFRDGEDVIDCGA